MFKWKKAILYLWLLVITLQRNKILHYYSGGIIKSCIYILGFIVIFNKSKNFSYFWIKQRGK